MAPQVQDYPRVAAAITGPGPGSYALPTLVGPSTAVNKERAPVWTMRPPVKDLGRLNDAPAPSYWPADHKLPTVTVKGRNFYEPKKLIVPGPNYNNTPLKFPIYESAPSYSMGARTRNRRVDQVPPSTRYTLPSLVGGKNSVSKSEPVWGISFVKPAHTSSSYDASRGGPGPAAYKVVNADTVKQKMPSFSLAQKAQLPSDKTQKPGPGAYNSETVTVTKRKAPSFSMGTRHSQYVLPVLTQADLTFT